MFVINATRHIILNLLCEIVSPLNQYSLSPSLLANIALGNEAFDSDNRTISGIQRLVQIG